MIKKLLCIFLFFGMSYASFAQDVDSLDIYKKNTQIISSVKANPNPFSISTSISFYAKKNTTVIFSVRDLLGNTVYSKSVLSKKGLNYIPFYKDGFHSGIYIYSLKSDVRIVSKRIIIQ